MLLSRGVNEMCLPKSLQVAQLIRYCVAILHMWLPGDEHQFKVFGLLALDFMDDIEVRAEQRPALYAIGLRAMDELAGPTDNEAKFMVIGMMVRKVRPLLGKRAVSTEPSLAAVS